MSIMQLLTHYSSDNSHALSTYIASMDAIIPYNPNMPAFDIDLSDHSVLFQLADSVSNPTAQGSTFDNEDGGKRSSRSGGALSHESISRWWPTVSVQDGRVILILYDDEGVEVRRKVVSWTELMKSVM